jgi:hypothetical protein
MTGQYNHNFHREQLPKKIVRTINFAIKDNGLGFSIPKYKNCYSKCLKNVSYSREKIISAVMNLIGSES